MLELALAKRYESWHPSGNCRWQWLEGNHNTLLCEIIEVPFECSPAEFRYDCPNLYGPDS